MSRCRMFSSICIVTGPFSFASFSLKQIFNVGMKISVLTVTLRCAQVRFHSSIELIFSDRLSTFHLLTFDRSRYLIF